MAKKSRTAQRIRQIEESTIRRVAIYLRRSTDEVNQPYSLEAQEVKLRAFVESQPGDWQIVKIYSDDASGATTEREDLQKMLRAARAGMFDTVLVYRVDRFSRRLRDLVGLLDELTDASVVFRSATEPFDTSTPVGRMLVQMLGVFAEFEREVIIDRVIAGMERKAAKGLWHGGHPPYGYAKDPDTERLAVVAVEAITVRRMFDLYTKDRLGTRAIANVLTEEGLRTRNGKPWSQRSVETVIINRTYVGEKHYRDISVIDAHPPIITAEQFDLAQRILTERSENIGQRAANASEYTLTGKIQCPQCGSAYIGTAAHGRNTRYRYYLCYARSRYGTKAGCDVHRFNADQLETAIGQALLDFYTTGQHIIAHAVNEVLAAQTKFTSAHRDELAQIKHDLKENSASVDRYLIAFEKGTLDDEDVAVQERLAKLKIQSRQLRARQAQLEFDLEQPPVPPSDIDLARIRDHIADVLNHGNHKARKSLFEALVDQIEIQSDDSVIPHFRIPTMRTDQGPILEGPALDQMDSTNTVRVLPHPVPPVGVEPTLSEV